MKLVVGLGNPGPVYADTRHNIGFRVVERVADMMRVSITKAEKQGLVASIHHRGERALLVKPQTFMNSSGEAVQALVDYYRIPPENVLIIYDDLALPVGKLRIRAKGSAGGHNGMRSIIQYLGTDYFPRLRVGIGAVPEQWKGKDYVLSAFNVEERHVMAVAVENAAEAVLEWLEVGLDKVMAKVNTVSSESK